MNALRWNSRPGLLRRPYLGMTPVLVALACFGFVSLSDSSAAPRKKRDDKSALLREPGAIYLEDFLDQSVKLRVKGEPPIYKSTQRKHALGTLKKNREVVVLAMTDKQYRVRGTAYHGTAVGWVLPSDLTSLDKEFVANLKALYEREKKVSELIDKGEIALGMTAEEVVESLGRPSRKTSRLDKGGRVDIYEYSTFEKIPQYRYLRDINGNLYRDTYYIKVESGKMTVTFNNKVVESIEQTEGEPAGGGKVRIVPAPIIIH